MNNKKIITFGERVNFAQTPLDEKNIITIMEALGTNITSSMQQPLQVFADLIRTNKLEEVMCLVSKEKTLMIDDLQKEKEALRTELEALRAS